MGGNDGPCFLKSCLALCVVYDPGVLLKSLFFWLFCSYISMWMCISVFLSSRNITVLHQGLLIHFRKWWMLSWTATFHGLSCILYHTCNLVSWILMLSHIFYAKFILQNDLIHAWGLDYQLGYCSQASYSLFSLSQRYLHTLFCSFQHIYLPEILLANVLIGWSNKKYWYCGCRVHSPLWSPNTWRCGWKRG